MNTIITVEYFTPQLIELWSPFSSSVGLVAPREVHFSAYNCSVPITHCNNRPYLHNRFLGEIIIRDPLLLVIVVASLNLVFQSTMMGITGCHGFYYDHSTWGQTLMDWLMVPSDLDFNYIITRGHSLQHSIAIVCNLVYALWFWCTAYLIRKTILINIRYFIYKRIIIITSGCVN